MTQTNPEQWAVELFKRLEKMVFQSPAGTCLDGEAIYVIQAAFAEREAQLVGAMKWAGEVSPPVNDFGCVTVDMSLYELNTMRVLAGFKPLPARKDRTHG